MDDAKTLHERVLSTPLRPGLQAALTHKCPDQQERDVIGFMLRWRLAYPDQRCALLPHPTDIDASMQPNGNALRLMEAYNWGAQQHAVAAYELEDLLHKAANVATIGMAFDRNPARIGQVMAQAALNNSANRPANLC